MKRREVQGSAWILALALKLFESLPHLGYHGMMEEIRSIKTLSSSSAGAHRVLWACGDCPKPESWESSVLVPGAEARLEGLVIEEAGLTLAKGVLKGAMEAGPMEAPEFDWMVPWWNADTAGDGYLEVFLQAEIPTGWSRWYSMGRWSRFPASFSDRDESGNVETDTLLLATKSRRFKLRAELSAGAGGVGDVVLRRLGIIARDRARIREPSRPDLLMECRIKAPERSQMLESAEIRGRICSPTSVAMALQSLGIDLPTAFVAADCYDAGAKIYGNWPFNVASLWRLGAVARLDFFPAMEMALGELSKGHLLIASIKFAEGCLRGAPISKTSGHLVLVLGLGKDETGTFRVLVNDPAAASPETAPRAYDLAEFEKAWTGIAYVIEGKR